MIHVTARRLRDIVLQIFLAAGVPPSGAELVTDSLVEASLAGHDSHGVLRVTQYVEDVEKGRVDPHGAISIIRQSATTAMLDGGRNFGRVAGGRGMEIAIDKAREHDLGMVVLQNCGHTGRLAEYVIEAAKAGCMGLVFGGGSTVGGSVAPFGGTSRVLNTNPIAWGIPAGDRPRVFTDYATSVRAGGKVMAAIDKGVSLPEGWLLDAEGYPTTDPTERLRGGILLPFGLHKGYGLSFMIEALTGGLTGTGCAPFAEFQRNFVLVLIAVNIAVFQPLDAFCDTVQRLTAITKSARKAPGVEEIYAPGEPEWQRRERLLREGLDLPDATWQRIVDVAARYSVPLGQ